MSFWHNLENASSMSKGFYWLVAGFLLAASLLFVYLPAERTRIRKSLLLFALAVAGLLAAATMLSFNLPEEGAAYRWTHWVALIIEGVAIVNLSGVLLFEVILKALRLRPPRIMRD